MRVPFTSVKIPFATFLLGPSLLKLLGFCMNALVMAVNGGQMPVLWPGGCTPEIMDEAPPVLHSCMSHATHLKFLADWVIRHDGVWSPGDFLLIQYDYSFIPALMVWATIMIMVYNRPDRATFYGS